MGHIDQRKMENVRPRKKFINYGKKVYSISRKNKHYFSSDWSIQRLAMYPTTWSQVIPTGQTTTPAFGTER